MKDRRIQDDRRRSENEELRSLCDRLSALVRKGIETTRHHDGSDVGGRDGFAEALNSKREERHVRNELKGCGGGHVLPISVRQFPVGSKHGTIHERGTIHRLVTVHVFTGPVQGELGCSPKVSAKEYAVANINGNLYVLRKDVAFGWRSTDVYTVTLHGDDTLPQELL